MALRYSCKSVAIKAAGTTIAHGLAAVPDEWFFNSAAAPLAAALPNYLTAAPTSTSITVIAGSATATVDVFVVVNHSIIK